MSLTQTMPAQMAYTTKSDAVRRHEQGITKSRKAVLTGGGRAWSEDEEAYLVQTRLQKMPYKHIAAHLKKTELACRLHYHQLTHGSNRRKRAGSVSSSSDHSPEAPVSAHGSSHERHLGSMSPTRQSDSYSTTAGPDMPLPRIMSASMSPRLPAILPKPNAMPNSYAYRYPPMQEEPSQLPPVNYHPSQRYQHTTPPPSRLEGSPLPFPSASAHAPTHVDMPRLQSIYDGHRDAFWNVIAKEYGSHMPPAMLEAAWKTGVCCRSPISRPLTPAASPEAEVRTRGYNSDKTRISSILSGDENQKW